MLYKINLLLYQSIKVLGFNQSGHLYFSTETTLVRYFAQLYEPSTMHPGRGVLPQNVLVDIQVRLQNQTPCNMSFHYKTQHFCNSQLSSVAGTKAAKGNPIHKEIQRIYISKQSVWKENHANRRNCRKHNYKHFLADGIRISALKRFCLFVCSNC